MLTKEHYTASPTPAKGTPGRVSIAGVTHLFVNRGHSLTALQEIGFSVVPSEFVSIVGPSGCGKTTLLRIVGGLLHPTLGEIRIDGQSPREAQRNKAIGFVFQEPALVPWRTVWQNVHLPFEVGNGAKETAQNRVTSLLDTTGLRSFRDYYPFQLSGGMQQRVALARALALEPSLLLMDEPFASLDELTRSSLRQELLRLWDLTHKTVLFVTHSIPEAVLLSDRVFMLSGKTHRLKAEVKIELPRPRKEGIEDSADFVKYRRELRLLLSDD